MSYVLCGRLHTLCNPDGENLKPVGASSCISSPNSIQRLYASKSSEVGADAKILGSHANQRCL